MEEVAKNYAKALFELVEEDKRNEYGLALKSLKKDFKENPDFYSLLCSYSLSMKEKKELAKKVIAPCYKLPYFYDFVLTLISHHRIDIYSDIVKAYSSLLNASIGVKEGLLYTAQALDEKTINKIEDSFSKRLGYKVELEMVVDPSLLGGVKVALDGKVYDGSLRERLLDLKKHLLQGGNAQ